MLAQATAVPAAARRSCPFVQTRVIRSPHSCRVQAGSNNSVGRVRSARACVGRGMQPPSCCTVRANPCRKHACRRSGVSHAAITQPPLQEVCTPSAHCPQEVYETVADAMTSGHIHSCGPDDTVDAALEMLVQHRITGLPVLDPTGHVVRDAANSAEAPPATAGCRPP